MADGCIVKFYEDNFGMKVINRCVIPPSPSAEQSELTGNTRYRLDFEEAKFSLYFLAFDSAAEGQHWTDREALLELTHNCWPNSYQKERE